MNKMTLTSVVLSFVGGYADTSTFVGAHGLFSAHVTGNFVVFAYDIVTNNVSGSSMKLLSFPVFILGVIFATVIINRSDINKQRVNILLVIEGFLLILTGVLAYVFVHETNSILNAVIPMLVVFALAMQNAYGRFYTKDVYAPTTVMTGNVTQYFIDLTNYLGLGKTNNPELKTKISNHTYIILPFLLGCLSGGLITKAIGLSSVAFIGILILLVSRKGNS